MLAGPASRRPVSDPVAAAQAMFTAPHPERRPARSAGSASAWRLRGDRLPGRQHRRVRPHPTRRRARDEFDQDGVQHRAAAPGRHRHRPGGLLSHAAIVARESGLPAVVGTTDATCVIPDGAGVRVDGTSGAAEVLRQWGSTTSTAESVRLVPSRPAGQHLSVSGRRPLPGGPEPSLPGRYVDVTCDRSSPPPTTRAPLDGRTAT
jgi:hypothetical protein